MGGAPSAFRQLLQQRRRKLIRIARNGGEPTVELDLISDVLRGVRPIALRRALCAERSPRSEQQKLELCSCPTWRCRILSRRQV